MNASLYNVGDVVYLRESAAIGFLEAVRISSILTSVNQEWTYTVSYNGKMPTPPTFGERIAHQQPSVPYFNESELLTFCDAADLIEAVLEQRLTEIRQQRDARC